MLRVWAREFHRVLTLHPKSVPSVNGAEGISDIEGKIARVSDEGVGQRPSFNGAEGISDIEGKIARVSGEGVGQRPSFNGAEGISDIEGKVARVSDEGVGQRPSFQLVVRFLLRDCLERRNRFVDDNPR